jgi:P pilus assembly chaperone PapD
MPLKPLITNSKMSMKTKKIILMSLLSFVASTAFAQNVSISPSRLYYKTPVGESKVQEVSLTNSSTSSQSFVVSFGDFEPSGVNGKSVVMKAGESENSCSQWLSADPSFFELAAGETKKIKVLMQVPSSPEANKVKWGSMLVKMAKEKMPKTEGDKDMIGMGITETFQFVIHIFQSPPTVTLKNASIESFSEITTENDSTRIVMMRVNNSGEAILDCVSYLEYTNLGNGTEERQKPIAYTLLPGASREIKFALSNSLTAGKYSVLGVVDYGSRENVQAAETEIEIKKQ